MGSRGGRKVLIDRDEAEIHINGIRQEPDATQAKRVRTRVGTDKPIGGCEVVMVDFAIGMGRSDAIPQK